MGREGEGGGWRVAGCGEEGKGGKIKIEKTEERREKREERRARREERREEKGQMSPPAI